MDVAIEGRPKNIGSEEGAADVYGNQAFKKSDEAKEAGLQGSNTAENLLNAFDRDIIASNAGVNINDEHELTEEENERMKQAKDSLIEEANSSKAF